MDQNTQGQNNAGPTASVSVEGGITEFRARATLTWNKRGTTDFKVQGLSPQDAMDRVDTAFRNWLTNDHEELLVSVPGHDGAYEQIAMPALSETVDASFHIDLLDAEGNVLRKTPEEIAAEDSAEGETEEVLMPGPLMESIIARALQRENVLTGAMGLLMIIHTALRSNDIADIAEIQSERFVDALSTVLRFAGDCGAIEDFTNRMASFNEAPDSTEPSAEPTEPTGGSAETKE